MNLPGVLSCMCRCMSMWWMMAAPAASPAPAAVPPPPPPPPPPAAVSTPFRLGLAYTRVLREDGDLTDSALGTNAVGLVFVSPSSSYVRSHFVLAHQWESAGGAPGTSAAGGTAKGFRVDLLSFGYPIQLMKSPQVRLDLEPIFTALRGEIMFVTGGGRFLRLESGFGLELSATFRRWFVGVQPLAIDFRYWFYGSSHFDPQSRTGLGRIFPFRATVGYEF
ncbi:MAG: hypothetical protein ABUR63_07955 [Verrucomicrobiota bacterium]